MPPECSESWTTPVRHYGQWCTPQPNRLHVLTLVTLTLLVISLMSTGARRRDRSFLCTHRKLISTMGI
jgi:hypothetical protein